MKINEDVPVIAVGEIVIAADSPTVWNVISAIDHWPRWNPDIRRASLDGKLAEGSKFRWKSGPGTITSTIRRVEKPHVLAWSGITLGVQGNSHLDIGTEGQ